MGPEKAKILKNAQFYSLKWPQETATKSWLCFMYFRLLLSLFLCRFPLVSPYFLLFHAILEPPNSPPNEVTGIFFFGAEMPTKEIWGWGRGRKSDPQHKEIETFWSGLGRQTFPWRPLNWVFVIFLSELTLQTFLRNWRHYCHHESEQLLTSLLLPCLVGFLGCGTCASIPCRHCQCLCAT